MVKMMRSRDILFEDNHLLVVSKQAGVLTQADDSNEDNLLDQVKEYIRIRDQKPGQVFLGLVHRLDRNTGGVICFAKTSKAAARLSDQLRRNTWKKRYLALSTSEDYVELSKKWLSWTDYLYKDQSTNVSSVVNASHPHAKEAKLKIRPIENIHHDEQFCYCFDLALETGRSHQIRVQLSSRGFPLIGDSKYQGLKNKELNKHFLGLWAYGLELEHPVTKESMRFVSLPERQYPWNLFYHSIQNTVEEFTQA